MLLNQDTSFSLKNILYPPTLPLDIRPACTFWAELKSVTDAHGKGSTTATFTRATVATHIDPTTGLIVRDASGEARFEANGYLSEGARTNLALYSEDFTNAAWVISNDTDITVTYDSTGPDGEANTASRLTSAATDATILQSITSGSAARVTSCWVKRITGTGDISMTQDNGTTWAVVTLTSGWTRVSIASATLANPVVGFKMATSGDAMDVSFFQHEVGAFISSAIPTTSAAVVRNREELTYPQSGNLTQANPFTLYVAGDTSAPGTSGGKVFISTRNSSNQSGAGIFNVTASTNLGANLLEPGTTQATFSVATDPFVAGTPKRMALACAPNDFELVSGGASRGLDTAGILPVASPSITIASDGNFSTQPYGHAARVAIFGARLSLFDMARLR